MSFEKKLQHLRKTAGLSQEELASELGVSRQAVSKWESGTSYPEMDKLILMTRLFKCSLDDLVNDEVKGKQIVTKKSSKGQAYIDSLLEFITKSINMFNSMKLSSVIKVFLEIIIFMFVIACFLAIVYGFVDSILYGSLNYGTQLYYVYKFITSIIFIVVFALGSIIVFQFYKIRYLDYYDKLVYKYEVNESKKDNLNKEAETEEVKSEKDAKEEIKSKVKAETKVKERIIIRDPDHKPLAFLSAISSFIILVFRTMLRFITIPFIFLFIFLVIALVVVIYLVSYHTLFIGIVVALIAGILLDVLVIYTLSHDLFKKAYPIKVMFILFLVSLLVGSIGVGATVVSLSGVNFKVIDAIKEEEKVIPFNDKLYLNFFGALEDDRLDFIVDDSRNDILINITYDDNTLDYTLDNPAGNPNYLLLKVNYTYDGEYNPKKEIEEFLDNLKNNVITSYNYRGYYFNVTVTANEKQIKSLINTISEYAEVYTTTESRNGYKYYHLSETFFQNDNGKICVQDDYYRKCIKVVDNTFSDDFKYEYKNNELIYDKNKYNCFVRGNGYVCTKSNNRVSYEE